MTTCFKAPSLSLILLFWFAADALLALANWWFCFSTEVKQWSRATSDAHGVFAFVSFVMFFAVASPLLFYPYYYRGRLRAWDLMVHRPAKKKELGVRTWRRHTILGVWVSFAATFPRFCVEFHVALNRPEGLTCAAQGTAMWISLITTLTGFLAVWGSYLWKVSKKFQQLAVSGMAEQERHFYLAPYRSGPFAVRYDDKGHPVWADGLPGPGSFLHTAFYQHLPPEELDASPPPPPPPPPQQAPHRQHLSSSGLVLRSGHDPDAPPVRTPLPPRPPQTPSGGREEEEEGMEEAEGVQGGGRGWHGVLQSVGGVSFTTADVELPPLPVDS